MKMVKSIYFVLITVFAMILVACAGVTDPAEMYKNESAEQIFQKGEKALRARHYAEAIKRFEALDAQYPYGKNTELAQLHIIYAYYMSNDYASADAAADRFIHAHPASPHVDYAYFMRGLSNYYQNMGLFERFFAVDLATRDLAQIKKSYADFTQLITINPNSYYAPAAHQYLIYLRNVLADHELEVAQFYYDRSAYIAAANRANLVVRHYQGSPAVPKALVIMVKSYQALNLKESAQDAWTVLQYNYPNSDYLKQAAIK
jgi:outer membrane protein assembly factor BamD